MGTRKTKRSKRNAESKPIFWEDALSAVASIAKIYKVGLKLDALIFGGLYGYYNHDTNTIYLDGFTFLTNPYKGVSTFFHELAHHYQFESGELMKMVDKNGYIKYENMSVERLSFEQQADCIAKDLMNVEYPMIKFEGSYTKF